jgi:hypothetical protein
MTPEMREAALIRQIQSYKAKAQLEAWGRLCGEGDKLADLDDSAKARVRAEYRAHLKFLDTLELASMP